MHGHHPQQGGRSRGLLPQTEQRINWQRSLVACIPVLGALASQSMAEICIQLRALKMGGDGVELRLV